ncbi:MAG TPA: trehalase family glycosidase [Phycisphaerae bacterium]|nr:trehalase family glycosidase [Phycisphaerae bacterium]
MELSRRAFVVGCGGAAMGLGVGVRWGRGAPATGPAGGAGAGGGLVPRTAAGRAFVEAIGAEVAGMLGGRLAKTNADIRMRGLKTIRGVANAGGDFLTGYPYTEFYDWDLYFENLYLSYYGVYPYCFTNMKEFLARQTADGYINRSLNKQRDRQHFKPFLAQLTVLGCRQNKDDYGWLKGAPEAGKDGIVKVTEAGNGSYYNRLKKYIEKWFSYDGDGNGLPTWNSADEAGTDNQWSRAGQLGAFEVEGVDLASYLVRELRALAEIAGRLGEKEEAAGFTSHADKVCGLMNDLCWDEKEGMYFDRSEKTKDLVRVKSATNFGPLFCGGATPGRAKRAVEEHLLNEKEFWLAYPVASYAKTEPDYYQGTRRLPNGANECNWRGPTWAPTNYMIFQGLRKYQMDGPAKELATRLLTMAVVKNPQLREYYNGETGEGIGQTQFWGFTALYYGMLLEWFSGEDASALEGPFRAMMPEEIGVEFGGE